MVGDPKGTQAASYTNKRIYCITKKFPRHPPGLKVYSEFRKIDMSSVLLVDDDRVQQLVISQMLFVRGLNVIIANDGIEALQKVGCYFPTLVILDIVLPKMNGYEVCRRIKKNKGTQSIPVIMFTAKSEEFDFYWGSKQGADAYVSKLCHPQLLIDTVNQLLQPLSPYSAP